MTAAVGSQTVTRFGEQYFDQLIFRRNARDRIQVNLGHGTFEYEGVLAKDNSELTAWRFSTYGGLAACEDPNSLRELRLMDHRSYRA